MVGEVVAAIRIVRELPLALETHERAGRAQELRVVLTVPLSHTSRAMRNHE
jgi:hypothetical protein